MKVSAHEVKHALGIKHQSDFFLTEVKNGSTWSNDNLAIMDALAIKKSWSKPCLTGYEVKVSRQDFLNDDKWPIYKEYCHRFYFACPKGLIEPNELPDDVGLIWFNPEKKTLYTRKKSKFRHIEMPTDMFYYIILSRMDNDRHPFFSSKRECLEKYVEDKTDKRELGRRVSSKLIQEMNDMHSRLEKLEREAKKNSEALEQNKKVIEIMRKHGMSPYRWNFEVELDKALNTSVPPNFLETLNTIRNASNQLSNMVKEKEIV